MSVMDTMLQLSRTGTNLVARAGGIRQIRPFRRRQRFALEATSAIRYQQSGGSIVDATATATFATTTTMISNATIAAVCSPFSASSISSSMHSSSPISSSSYSSSYSSSSSRSLSSASALALSSLHWGRIRTLVTTSRAPITTSRSERAATDTDKKNAPEHPNSATTDTATTTTTAAAAAAAAAATKNNAIPRVKADARPEAVLSWVAAAPGGAVHSSVRCGSGQGSCIDSVGGVDNGGEWGLYAAADIPAGTDLIRLPASCLLGSAVPGMAGAGRGARAMGQLATLSQQHVPSELWQLDLALRLLHERLRNERSANEEAEEEEEEEEQNQKQKSSSPSSSSSSSYSSSFSSPSPWQAYIEALPLAHPTNPLFLTAEGQNELHDVHLRAQLGRRLAAVAAVATAAQAGSVTNAPAEEATDALFANHAAAVTPAVVGWALATVTSRAFCFDSRVVGKANNSNNETPDPNPNPNGAVQPDTQKPGRAVGYLLPGVDLMNHSFTPTAQVRRDAAGNVTVTATRDILSGEELCFTYGHHNNRTLLLDYGFVVTDVDGNEGGSGSGDGDGNGGRQGNDRSVMMANGTNPYDTHSVPADAGLALLASQGTASGHSRQRSNNDTTEAWGLAYLERHGALPYSNDDSRRQPVPPFELDLGGGGAVAIGRGSAADAMRRLDPRLVGCARVLTAPTPQHIERLGGEDFNAVACTTTTTSSSSGSSSVSAAGAAAAAAAGVAGTDPVWEAAAREWAAVYLAVYVGTLPTGPVEDRALLEEEEETLATASLASPGGSSSQHSLLHNHKLVALQYRLAFKTAIVTLARTLLKQGS